MVKKGEIMMKKSQDSSLGQLKRSRRVSTELPTFADGVRGVTRDISASGLYLVQDQPCEKGSRIEFWVDLKTPTGDLKLSAEGEVIRVEKVDDGRFGIGIKILRQVIQSVDSRLA